MSEVLPRILVVDDEPINLQVVGTVLRDSGRYRLSFAQSGEEALTLLQSEAPELILLDVTMPGLSGIEVCREVKSNPLWRAIPVIFLTARVEPKDLVEGFEAGGADYVNKPFEPEILIARVESQLQLYLYHQREERQRGEERAISYSNGLTEMGATVLHNVGNAMVGVNSRLGYMGEFSSKLDELGRSLQRGAALLQEGGNEERVTQLLGLAAQLLREEYAVNLQQREAEMSTAVNHVNAILDAQRNVTSRGLMPSHFQLDSLVAEIRVLLGDEFRERGIHFSI